MTEMHRQTSCVLLLFALFLLPLSGQGISVERWNRYEIRLKGPQTGNPFDDVVLKGAFCREGETDTTYVTGFYDGNGEYALRFMPGETGAWHYRTISNASALNGKTGIFECTEATEDNHGPVAVRGTYDFKYADETPYYPFGTTVYALIHQDEALESRTFETLAAAPFNKVRMCVFPKNYAYNKNEPRFYPFEKGTGNAAEAGNETAVWDFARFDPEFFRHLEACIDRLGALGIQCDLILFHPYDKGRWGFDRMTRENDLRYLRYVVARLSSFRNVWWSMANEFDYMREKTPADWEAFLRTVAAEDPYGHLRSVHNGDRYFNHTHPLVTHASLQNASILSDFGRAGLMRDVYAKPIVMDEFCYEGNFPERWGDLSAQEMTHRCWQGAITGAYLTHGETFLSDDDVVWWSKGGVLKGESPARIAFLRDFVEKHGSMHIIDNWRNLNTAVAESGAIVIYFGKEAPGEWEVNLPAKTRLADGTKLKIDMVDTWNMTTAPVAGDFTAKGQTRYVIGEAEGRKVKLPGRPYMALVVVPGNK